MNKLLSAIGRNINQIAKNLNLTKELDQQAFSQIQMIRLDLNNELERLRNVK